MVLTQLLRPEELSLLNERDLDVLEDHIERELVTNAKIHDLLKEGVEKNVKALGRKKGAKA